jgi:transposase
MPTTEIAAWIGLDWGDRRHWICLQVAGSSEVETEVLEQKPDHIHQWVAKLRRRFGGQPVALALEQSRGPLIYALMQYDFLILYPINPKQLARYRQAFRISGAKDDPKDSQLLLDLLRRHHHQLSAWQPEDVMTRSLRRLVEERRKLVGERTRLVNRLQALLKEYFPQVLEWFTDVAQQQCLAFLLRWPSLAAAQASRRSTLDRFFQKQRCGERKRQEKIKSIQEAVALTEDAAVQEVHPFLAQLYVRQLQVLQASIDQLEEQIQQMVGQHPKAEIFASFPGAGPTLAPRLLVAFGSNTDRLDAYRMQCFSGIAPVTKQSGNSEWIHHRLICPKFLKQTFHEFAKSSIPHCGWANAFYRLQRQRGHDHHQAIRALAYQWIRILTRCWAAHTPYCEDTYLQALRRSSSPLIAFMEAA